MLFKDKAHESRLLGVAIAMAVIAHGKTDALYAGKPYLLHPLRVMAKVSRVGTGSMIVAVLHDTLEDTTLDTTDMELAGIPERLIVAVEVLTRRGGEFYAEYIKRVKKDPIAAVVKLADIEDHLDHSATMTDSHRNRYLRARSALR